jgi:hypothetical protein
MTDPIRIFSQAESLTVADDGESTGPAEPYLWCFHWKVDGESLAIRLTIGITDNNLNSFQPPELTPDFEPFLFATTGSHGNLPTVETETISPWLPRFLPWPNNPQATQTVTIPAALGRFETDMLPIPMVFDFILPDDLRGTAFIFSPEQLDQALVDALNLIDNLGDAWRLLFPGEIDLTVTDITDWLNEPETDDCPPLTVGDLEAMLEHMLAEFVTSATGGIDGVFGSVFVLMEQDLFSASHAAQARQGVEDMIRELLTTVVGTMSIQSPVPNPEPYEEQIGAWAAVQFLESLVMPPLRGIGAAWDEVGEIAGEWTSPSDPPMYGDPDADPTVMIMNMNQRIAALVGGIAGVAGLVDADDPLLVANLQLAPEQLFDERTFDFRGNEDVDPDSPDSDTITPFAGKWTLHVRTGPA